MQNNDCLPARKFTDENQVIINFARTPEIKAAFCESETSVYIYVYTWMILRHMIMT